MLMLSLLKFLHEKNASYVTLCCIEWSVSNVGQNFNFKIREIMEFPRSTVSMSRQTIEKPIFGYISEIRGKHNNAIKYYSK